MNPTDLPIHTLAELADYDREQQEIARIGKPPNAAEWECYFRREVGCLDNVELTGASRLAGEASSDRRERG